MSELIEVIRRGIRNHPRSQQKAIGPSGVGTPCDAKIGYQLAGVAPVNTERDSWLPTIGTATHSWLADQLTAENERLGRQRYLIEQRVEIPLPGGRLLFGNADGYDLDQQQVFDWKVVGDTTLKKAARHGPSEGYRIQAHIYGLGFWWTAEYQPKSVAIVFLPRNQNSLDKAVICEEPFDAEIAGRAIERLSNIQTAVDLMGAGVLSSLRRVDDYCSSCPFYAMGSVDPERACAGSDSFKRQVETIPGLVGTPTKKAS